MTSKAEKAKRWSARGLRLLAYASFIIFPVGAVLEKFPVWVDKIGVGASLGFGGLLIGIILAWTLRNALGAWLQKLLGGFVWSQSKFWCGGTVILLILNAVGEIVADILVVWIAGCIGMAVGTVLLLIAGRLARPAKPEETKGGVTDGADPAEQNNR